MKKLDPVRIIETIEKLGVRKSIKYAFIGSGCILVVVVPVCCVVTFIKSHAKTKEQNNASTNKQKEIERISECKKGEEDRDHAHRMEENTQVHEHHMEEIEAKKNADIEKMEKRAELRKERDAAKANQPLVDLHLNSIPESYHEALKNGIVHVSRERTLGFSWLREGYDTGLVGPTDCGKSVFVMQVAMALARGRCDVNLSSEWHDIPPMPVVMFSLEQSNHEIREYYGSVIDNLSTLKLYAGSRITPAHIITVIKEEMEKADFKLDYKVGTMIEIPRAALTADEIAKEAEFFSFGTNDLTQMTFGFSRDDAGKFLNAYYDKKIYENDPFAKLDQKGVGKLVKMAAKMGRETRFDIHMGICGEHGGDPSSIEFCHKVGLDYVSCSPFRVPIARLAAAQAAIKENK